MTRQVRGEFEVTMTPQSGPDAPVGRFALAKAFHDALKAASIGEMLALSGSVAGSAGYVAMERVTGSLEGRHFYIFDFSLPRELRGSTSGPVRLEPGERSLQLREFDFLGLFRQLRAAGLEQAAAVEGGDAAVGKRLVQPPKVAFGILADAFPTQRSHARFCLKGC
jgi:hypothetical protein